MEKIEKLKQLMELLQHDTVRPQEIEKFLKMLLEVIKKTNENFRELSIENLQKIEDFLAQIKTQHNEVLSEIDGKSSELEGSLNAKIATVERLLKEVSGIKATPGYTPIKGVDYFDGTNPDPSEVVPLVLKEIPPVVLDDGSKIVEKINALEIEPDKQIDFSHIKGFKQEVQKQTVGFQRNVAWFDESTLVVDNPTRIKVVGAGAQLSMDSDGALVLTISGGAAANESNGELLTDTGDHTNFTFANAPTGVSVVWRGETGQIQTPSSYSVVGTTLTFTSAQVDGEGTAFTIYANSKY